MSWLINLVAKIGGVSKLWGFLDGKKTALAGVAALLSGLGGLVGEIIPIIAAQNAAQAWAFVQGLPADPAWQLIVGGLATLGLGHKISKLDEPAASPK